MAVKINKGNMVIECKGFKDFEHWLHTRKAIIESIQSQSEDFDCNQSNYYLLELLLDLEPTINQAKQLFK